MLRKWSAVVLALLAVPALALAQGTGKVAGTVTDATTGEALPGATVQLQLLGTTLGTATHLDGNYYIIGVPVGTYDVRVSFVGYQTETVAGAEVKTGYTRELNFALQPLALAQGTGKVAGTVTDATTGEALPGATVQLQLLGTTLGTATHLDGNYYIIGVPVGTYDVRVSFVGYQTETVAGAEVKTGYTRELNFALQRLSGL